MPIIPPRRYQPPAVPPPKLHFQGPLVKVTLTITDTEASIRPDNRPTSQVIALIDTGARGTAISARVARSLQLTRIDTIESRGAHGPKQTRNVYSINFTLDGSSLLFRDWRVAEIDLENDPHDIPLDMLLGRDALALMDFRYDGAKADFSIEIPSSSHKYHPDHPDNKPAESTTSSNSKQEGNRKQRRAKNALAKAARKKNRK